MNADYEDRVLESGLQEVLGGQYPPDLSAKILQEFENRQSLPTQDPPPMVYPLVVAALAVPPPVVVNDVTTLPVSRPSSPVVVRHPSRRRRNRTTWLSVAVTASLVIAMVGVGVYVGQLSQHRWAGTLVQSEPLDETVTEQVDAPGEAQDRLPQLEMPLARLSESEPSGARERSHAALEGDQPRRQPEADLVAASSATPAMRRGTPLADGEVIAFVNEMLSQRWRQRGITPAPPSDDTQWCQRVYQRLVGRGPTRDELRQFLDAPRSERRGELVDRLLVSEDYTRHWATFWADVLLGATAGQTQRSGSDRHGLEQFLLASLQENKPYDRIAAELIAATGSCDPESPEFNGAANFLAAYAGNGALTATDRVARVFLGKQMVCARCHNDPSSGWEQDEFWRLNAFFRQMQARRDSPDRPVSLVDSDFYGETGIVKDAEIFYRGEDGRLRVAYPQFGGESISRSGLVAEVNRRQELARLLAASPDFRSAAVNRVWAGLLRYGFVEPVDDAGPHNPPSHPELLGGLAGQLEAHDFDLNRLVRWIVLSKAFDVSDQPTPESWMDSPETGAPPLFARFYTEPTYPVDLHRELMLAVRTRPSTSPLHARTLARRSWTPSSPAVPQIIDTQGSETMIGPPWLDRLAASSMSRDQKVEHLFRAVLDRKPTTREATAAKLVLADRMNDHTAVRELWQILFAGRSGRPRLVQQ